MKRGLKITAACCDRDESGRQGQDFGAVRYGGDRGMEIRNAAAERALGPWL
jgi:hypothetical protein